MAFNFLNRICSQQPDTDLNDIGMSVDKEKGNDFDNESDIDIEEEDRDFRPDLDLDLNSDNEDQSIDLEPGSGDGVECPWSATLNDFQVQLFTSRVGPKLENTGIDYTSEPIDLFRLFSLALLSN